MKPRRFAIQNGFDIGSCPYVYSHSSDGTRWLNEGNILYGRVGKQREATDEKVLNRFDGKILIREIDPEVSFIDCLFVRVLHHNGSELILYPNKEVLRFEDGKYLRLTQGEDILVDFDLPTDFPARSYVLVAKGYYVPYRN